MQRKEKKKSLGRHLRLETRKMKQINATGGLHSLAQICSSRLYCWSSQLDNNTEAHQRPNEGEIGTC